MNLLTLQRQLRTWLTEESPDAAASLGTAALPGLSVHLNNYRGQLMACLTEAYPTVRAWLGDAAFEGAAAVHIDRVPPGSWTLDDYADGLPGTLASLYTQDAEVGELALLELALSQAFTGPDCPQLLPDTLGDTDWEGAVLTLVPTFKLLPARTNAAAIWSAVSARIVPPAAAALEEPASVAVWRCGFTPRFRTLSAAEAEALRNIRNGMTFGDLCAQAVAGCGEAQGAILAGGWLGQWIQDGLIAGVNSSPGVADLG